MAKIDKDMILLALNLITQAFKKGRIKRIIEELEAAGVQYDTFQAARMKLDIAANNKVQVTLSAEEAIAIDFAMDRIAKIAEKIKRRIRES